ncbi:MAG TPA: RimK/LysX family protein [Lacipirellulaceae bacterium]|nr:RimK/LysX family protein [Lacipirellulaceae bacterium]
MTPPPKPNRQIIGWREWISLPQLGIDAIKPKIDTGARSSSLHAFNVETFERGGSTWVRFDVHPIQRDVKATVKAEARVLEFRHGRSSSGHQSLRPVIRTDMALGNRRWAVELTLAARDDMGFRMLLGREAVRGRFVVDPEASFLIGKPPIRRITRKSIKKKRG